MKIEDNIAFSMEALLNPESIKKNAATSSAKEALVSLAKAAEIMDAMDLYAGSELVTQIMEQVNIRIK